MRSRVAGTALTLVLLAGCADDSSETSSSTTTTAVEASVPNGIDLSVAGPTSDSGRLTIPGFDEIGVEVTSEAGEVIESCLLLAAAIEQHAQGLMNVVDLGEYAGMLFDFPSDTNGAFWMRDTPLPLSIAYLDAEGGVVSTGDMDPCLDLGDQCPSYPPDGFYNDAVEVLQGGLEALGLDGPGARLIPTGSCAPV